ncbi:MAG: hypothetical protein JJ930_09770 [Roseitalea sp.]|nr:hypothetical protein [Roseitalea sp.]
MTVASCASDAPVIVAVDTPRPTVSPSLKQPCADPQPVPQRDLTKREVIVPWNRDRAALRDCKARHGALVEEVELIEAGGADEGNRDE